MGNIGLFYVGAVLIVNGAMLLGWVTPRGAAPLNLFVGLMQVFTPTYLVLTAGGDPAIIHAAAGLYLFGFTYLWVGINALAGLPGHGLGWFSLFVAAVAVAYATQSFAANSPVFGIIWLAWAALWLLFFLLLGLERTGLTTITGAVALVEGLLTAALPAWLAMSGSFRESWVVALAGAGVGVVLVVVIGWGASHLRPVPRPAP
ncbi:MULTISPECIES: AmiS/UreI family transporter [unclassified Mycolicibacterium]|uniref:AmiS/UreI family transporter n=1 Tax=unclassified Mycolicibacterium TaxID=2636767 RepID=UPI0012DDC38E|nr:MULTISPECIES: AmiS/UreI family transporter [unclassified Mycolicibacterium]MUL85636.1 transporter [Mycolicibacterium sp. CBMA 329]MUL88599.1 transporter [Mycolicibacterium sp. CBMA 331]MUM02104.1 transporter [Mycolicibacterium sp. CBMA 334]MUM29280.1 transporter [Mycolicibacterium sp. CBMA 295]MUM40246.1 transporter [Mycolicibacterium sp. CBMA 247]